MKIGELARRAGCPVETVRYYEKEALLPEPLRDQANNYRSYDTPHLERLLFIRRCRALDMTHEEIRALLQARNRQDGDCASIDAVISEHLRHVQLRIQELQALEQQLMALNQHCNADRTVNDCGILRELELTAAAEEIAPTLATDHLGGVHSH